jgi:hypothetical protein
MPKIEPRPVESPLLARLADRLMPWVAAHATVWPSTHAVHGVLLDQAREAHDDADVASMQAAFWRRRAIELGADAGEWLAFAAKTESDGDGSAA